MLEDNPYGLLRYEGEPLPTLHSLDDGQVRHLPRDVLEDPLARRCAWAGRSRRAPVLDKMNVGKQGVDLCSSSMTQCFVAAYFEETRWQDYLGSLIDSTGAGAT